MQHYLCCVLNISFIKHIQQMLNLNLKCWTFLPFCKTSLLQKSFFLSGKLLVSNNSQFLGIPNVIQLLYKQSHNINIIRISMWTTVAFIHWLSLSMCNNVNVLLYHLTKNKDFHCNEWKTPVINKPLHNKIHIKFPRY